jgi:leucyl-tRNA synthetase
MKKYNHKKIEPKWQKKWEKEKIYQALDFGEKPKYYALVEFPYPSGDGLHAGHVRSYTAMDIVARKRRMDGYNVLYPIGWDAFGLPTENYAIKNGLHPKIVTKRNTDTFRRQLKSLGFSFDWEREINTTDPKYYKWTQWIFLQLYKHGLAYKKKMPINWCLSCKVGLANEEVVDGKCERCGGTTEKRDKEQWLLAITKYADKLLEDLKTVDYLEKIKIQQANWIGRSEGLEEYWQVDSMDIKLATFTTWPHTTWGATFMVIAPEHPIIEQLVKGTEYEKGANEFIKNCIQDKIKDRLNVEKKKEGYFIGRYVINNLTGWKMPLYIANFAIMDYGTGIVKCTPTHDERDFEFAKKYNLPLKLVIQPQDSEIKVEDMKEAYIGEGIMINAGQFTGMDTLQARKAVADFIVAQGMGKYVVNFHLRDWIFSRQHYWGEPIPIIFCEKCGEVPVSEKDLPVKLPDVKNYEPTDTGESPLAGIEKWVKTKCPKCGGPARRETDTMPNWAGSSWYFLRYIDPKNDKEFASREKLDYWAPVDWYNGGMEHTTLHLLYSRFWNKFFYDIGVIPNSEPYQKRTSQGMVLGTGGVKMSKSKGNVVNPDAVVANFGADTLRLYEMFMGPFDQAIPWDEKGLNGCYRFLIRMWEVSTRIKRGLNTNKSTNTELTHLLHKTIKKVGEDIETMSFNTAVSSLMIFANECYKLQEIPQNIWEKFLVILAPFAPFIAEELWANIGNKKSIHLESWPKFDSNLIKDKEIEIVVQINGKLRDRIIVAAEASEEEIKKIILASEKVKQWTGGKEPKKIIYVKGKLVSIVI